LENLRSVFVIVPKQALLAMRVKNKKFRRSLIFSCGIAYKVGARDSPAPIREND